KLVHDRLDPCSALPNTGADRVDPLVVAKNGQLGPLPRLSGHALDLDQAFGDLGHLELDEFAKQVRVRAAHDDVETAIGLLDFEDVDLDPLVGPVVVGRDLLALGKLDLVPVDLDHDVRLFSACNEAADDFADQVAEL